MGSPTIYDVARMAGVATSTVSRTYSSPERVSDATRSRVLDAARELGYVPNPHARALTSARTQTIAMVVSDITNPHFFELIRGAEMRAKAAGYTLVLVNAEESARIEVEQIARVARSVDGFLLAASRQQEAGLRELAAAHPVVLINRRVRGVAAVILEHTQGCRQIVDHLASLGHTSVVYLAGPATSWMAGSRWAAIYAAATEYGMTVTRAGPYTPTVANGGAAADAAVRTGATAIIAHNDLLAIGVLRRLADRSIRVPRDVSVVGFDNIFAADLCTPALTTLGGHHEMAGRAAVEILLDRVTSRGDHSPAPQVVLPTELALRASTGLAPTPPGDAREPPPTAVGGGS